MMNRLGPAHPTTRRILIKKSSYRRTLLFPDYVRGNISNICLDEGHREEEVKVGALAQHPGVVTEGEVGGDHVEQSEHRNIISN